MKLAPPGMYHFFVFVHFSTMDALISMMLLYLNFAVLGDGHIYFDILGAPTFLETFYLELV